MFAGRYFGARYFTRRFWAKVGATLLRYRYTVLDASAPRYAVEDDSQTRYQLVDQSAPRYAVTET